MAKNRKFYEKNIKNKANTASLNEGDSHIEKHLSKDVSESMPILQSRKETSILKEIFVKNEVIEVIIKRFVRDYTDYVATQFNELVKEVSEKLKSRFIRLENIDAWLDVEQCVLFENKPEYLQLGYNYWIYHKEKFQKVDGKKIKTFTFTIPSFSVLQSAFSIDMTNPLAKSGDNYVEYGNYKYDYLAVKSNDTYGLYVSRKLLVEEPNCGKYRTLVIRACNLVDDITNPDTAVIVKLLLSNKLIPQELSPKNNNHFKELCSRYYKMSKYIKIFNNKLILDSSDLYKDVIKGVFADTLFDVYLNYEKIRKSVLNQELKIANFDAIKDELLKCDFKRANLSPYTERQISDLNLGHWELFEKSDQINGVKVKVPNYVKFVARPPQMDVVRNGVCGIDFGTKSTVVACFRNEARLLRVGEGDYTRAPVLTDYENPTAIEFRDFSGFCQRYAERIGRPFTEWEQVTVSHQAAEAIFREKDVQYSVFSELKQWAIDKKRRLLFCDGKGKTFEIRPYWELKENDFDPIEAYAYYLGLYINNMNNGIYLNYLLSFPVNYEVEVRNKLLKSFEKGLRKSLPPTILNDNELMEDFEVCAGASEPAAYAISALQEFDLQPKEVGEKVCYGVFDFGGGTTDFDFGIEEIPENQRTRYAITQFGNGGDVYLGGENILLLLAYEVYKDNLAIMRKHQIPFVLPPKGELFSGAETLIFNRGEGSQLAYLNSRRLAERLRPIWERHIGYKETFGNESTDIKMHTNLGNITEVQLKVNVDDLEKCIQSHIESGVENFFVALRRAFKDKDVSLPIHIFLAGNSCKSPVVINIFEKYISMEEAEATKIMLRNSGKAISMKNCFKLHLPLGVNSHAEETKLIVDNIKKRRNAVSFRQKQDINFDKMLTGKTGVVFGLLRSRESSRDVRIINLNNDNNNQVQFRYLLGVENYGGVFKTVIGLSIPYNEWVYFVPADFKSFELLYTSEYKALEGNMPISKVNMLICKIDSGEVAYEESVFVRKIAPDKIQYAVGTADDFKDFKEEYFKHKIYTKYLKD